MLRFDFLLFVSLSGFGKPYRFSFTVEAGFVAKAEDYLYSAAIAYAGGKELVEVIIPD